VQPLTRRLLVPRMLATILSTVTLCAPQGAAACERMVDLFRQGYQLVATEHLSFEGCEFDKAIPIGGLILKCQTYECVYHYGKTRCWAARSS
jgi:hypothetical protein